MCGLFGALPLEPPRLEDARRALHTLAHRGPDQWGEWQGGGAYLGHRRLAIRDLSERGRQPFVSRDGAVAAVVNGEIYNDAALRRELGEERFRSRCDSEVVLHGYRTWGLEGLLERLDGMFALAIFDSRERRLLLARDRFGQKPLFYAQVGGRLLFASEIKALLAFEPALRAFSLSGVATWLARRGGRDGSTLFAGVERLPPGTWLEARPGRAPRLQRWYDLLDACAGDAAGGGARPEPEALDAELNRRLQTAVSKRLLSDVPVGLQLSGGIDSSLVAAAVQDLGREKLHAFSIGFAEPRFARWSESEPARAAAHATGAVHHAVEIGGDELAQAFERGVWLCDGMLDFPNTLALQILCARARPHVTVMLSGEGADELFGGYARHPRLRALAARPAHARWRAGLALALAAARGGRAGRGDLWQLGLERRFAGRPAAILEHVGEFVSERTVRRLLGVTPAPLLAGLDPGRLAGLPFARALLLVDHATYLHALLERQDRASMGAAVEARAPFLDRELVEWASALDPDLLYGPDAAKRPLKRRARQRFGPAHAERPKMGFPMPRQQLLAEPGWLGVQADRALADDFALYDRIDPGPVRRCLAARGFDRHGLAYADSEREWLRWYWTVLRSAQDVFGVRRVTD